MHNLIVGISYTGKSNLCKRIAADMNGANIIVYDPLQSPGWPENASKFSSPDKFLSHVEKASNAFVFVDEAKTLWDHDDKKADALLYKRRHQGLLVFVIAQRATMVKPNARNQCSKLFAFKQTADDAKTLAGNFHDGLDDILPQLAPGEFVYTDGHTLQVFELDYADLPPFYREVKKNSPVEINT